MIHEMQLRKTAETISTIYLGGGTPSMLAGDDLKRLFRAIYYIYNVSDDAEVTMECNPEDVTTDFCSLLSTLPINRVSMGVQTFDDRRLQWLHRRHDSLQVVRAVENLRWAGIKNLSLDLIYGFPGADGVIDSQTLDEWKHDVESVVSLSPQHISAYTLMYEEGTPLCRLNEKEKLTECSDDTVNAMFTALVSILTTHGYEHYEISNFALPGFRSRHNSSYWQDIPYIGIGAAAHSYSTAGQRIRQWNVSNITDYIAAITANRLPFEQEEIDERTHYNDLVTTQLRTCEGLDLECLIEPFRTHALQHAQQYIDTSLLALHDNYLHLTEQGVMVSDMIMTELIML